MRHALVALSVIVLLISAAEITGANSLTGPVESRHEAADRATQKEPNPVPNSMRHEITTRSQSDGWTRPIPFESLLPASGSKQTYNVLFCIADNDQPGFRGGLAAYPAISAVDYFDARAEVPALATLLAYDVVVTYPNYAYSDMVATGDTLAAYVRHGGAVICGGWCWYLWGNYLDGEIMDSLFNPFTGRGGGHYSDTTLGWYDPTHPIMAGVTAVTEIYRDSLMINPGTTPVATWADGEWFIGTKGKVVGINGVPRDGGNWTGDMILIFHNAAVWTQTIAEYALVQDKMPWSFCFGNQDVLLSQTIPFDVYTSSDIGVADLSPYKKVIIPSDQSYGFYSTVSSFRAWFEAYVSGGGVLEFHGACFFDQDWTGLTMPTGFSCSDQPTTYSQMVSIHHPGHPLVVKPHVVPDTSLDNWNYSTHGYLTGLLPGHDAVLQNDDFSEPCLAVQAHGDGWVIAAMNTLEWSYYWGHSPILENVILWMPGATYALIQDVDPWPWYFDYNANLDILSSHGISCEVYGAPHVKHADLSMYDRVIVSSCQSGDFYDSLSTYRARFEDYMQNGGVFEFHGAAGGDYWSGVTMPTGFTSAWYTHDSVSIQAPGHPIVTTPHTITDAGLDEWNSSTHGDLVSLIPGYTEVLRNDATGNPCLAVLDWGAGWLVVTLNPIEYAWGFALSPLLENILLYDPFTAVEEIPAIPDLKSIALHQNRPNPFDLSTSISYELPRTTRVSLKLYDKAGRLVRTLVDGVEGAGLKRVVWNGKDQYGKDVANGVYFYTLESEEKTLTKKLVFVR